MKLTLKSPADKKQSYNTQVLFLFKDSSEKGLPKTAKKALADKLFTGAKHEILFIPCSQGSHHLLLAGLGPKKGFSHPVLLQTAALVYRTLSQKKISSSGVDFSALGDFSEENIQALASGFYLASYRFDDHKKSPKQKSLELILLAPPSASKAALNSALSSAKTICESMNFTRWLADTPANFMTPAILAEQALKKAKGTPLKVTVWNKEKIKKENMGGLIGVSLGSHQEPRFIIMEYRGGKASEKPICFVGKGVTFDTGGISLKPASRMDEMKYDMCGAAAVIGATLAIVKMKLKVNVLSLVPATENMPGLYANKPGDVLRARNGKTMEVLNTDAEGRLILADALSYACEKKPAVIFDAATLTGAMLYALGNSHTGFFTRNQSLAAQILKAGEKAGEKLWPMPLTDDHTQDIKSEVADVANIATMHPSAAGSATAAAFLEHFVEKSIPWAHFDIAGTAWGVSKRVFYSSPKGASGAIVRTFIELAKSYAH